MQGKYKLRELSLDGRKMWAKLYCILYRLKYRVVCLQVTLPALSVLTASICHNAGICPYRCHITYFIPSVFLESASFLMMPR